MERRPPVDFTSGYFQRSMDKLPRQGSRDPWRIHQNYVRDLIALRFAPLDDGVLEFTSQSVPHDGHAALRANRARKAPSDLTAPKAQSARQP